MKLDKKLVELAVIRYINQWLNYDCRFHAYVSDSTIPMHKRRGVFLQCLNFYSISRNVQPQLKELMNYRDAGCGAGYNPEKHKKILMILDYFVPTNNWVKDVETLQKELYTKLENRVRLLSLTSKILWQKSRGSNLVFDNDARRALNTRENDIKEFYGAWTSLYNSEYNLIVKVVEDVLDRPETPVLFHNIPKYKQDWFYRRVLDIYLVTEGRKL